MNLIGPRHGSARAALLLLLWLLIASGGRMPAIPQTAESVTKERIEDLREEIERHDDLYFKQAKPEISDTEYDRLKRELQALEQMQPDLPQAAREMGDDRSGRFPTQVHRVRMTSLDKAYTEAEWRAFHTRLAKQLGRSDLAFIVEPKYDGLAISLTYEDRRLVRAVTRGNGTEGDDVTANARVISGLPQELRADGAPLPSLVELRGEVYIATDEFARLNAEREAVGEEVFAHPRNLAAGTLKSVDPAEVAERRLSLVIHGWGAWEGAPPPPSQQAFHARVKAWGLPAVTDFRMAGTGDAVWAAVLALGRERARLGYPIDGVVVKLDQTALRAQVGEDESAPRWAIACKYAPERAVTRLRAITIQVGRTGVLTPVAEFDPVELGGSTVARATLHNRDEIVRRDIRVGDFIEVEKAGEIIPAVVCVQMERRPADAKPYLFPVHCPSCETQVKNKPGEAAVRCPNARCPAQRQRRLEHFASAQAVDIKGLGPVIIAASIRSGAVQSPADLYRLGRADLLGVEGVGEKMADRLLAEIERSKTAELWRFVHGLGIPRVGAVTSRQLAVLAGDLPGFARLGGSRLTEAVGPAAAEAVTEFLSSEGNQADLRAMQAAGVQPKPPAGSVLGVDLRDKVFVFTGALPGLTRAQASELVRAAGGIVRDNVSRQTDYVVAGEETGAKLAEAGKLGVKIINAEEFKALLGLE